MTARRVDSPLLLVGSLPAPSTDAALRAGADLFGALVFALPDGETGPRAAWVGYEREQLTRPTPDVVVVEETESPTGRPRHAYETPVFGIRPGVSELRFDAWPRIDDAIASYGEFAALTARHGGPVPHYPAGPGQVKVPAAWLIERAGFSKGHTGPGPAPARISTKHTLALVNPGGATTAGLLALAREIQDGVRAAFGVSLDIEPVLVGAVAQS